MLAVRMWPMVGSTMCGQLAASVWHGHVSGWGGASECSPATGLLSCQASARSWAGMSDTIEFVFRRGGDASLGPVWPVVRRSG